MSEPRAAGRISFEWSLDPDTPSGEANSIAEKLRSQGGQVVVHEPPPGILPLAIPVALFGVVVVVGLTEQVYEWWLHVHSKGLLIHATKAGKVEIKNLDVPYGWVIYIGPDGAKATLQNVSRDKLQDLLSAVSKGINPAGTVASSTQDTPAGET